MRRVETLDKYFESGIDSLNWYADANRQIVELAKILKVDTTLLAGVIATTSPRCSVRRNIRLTLHWFIDGTLPVGTMKMITDITVKWVERREMTGPKISAFRDALLGKEVAVIDSWMFWAYYSVKSGSSKLHREAVALTSKLSKRYGQPLQSVQAAIWNGVRQSEGYLPVDFPVLSEYRKFTNQRSQKELFT